MKAIAICASPRRGSSTEILLREMLAGAEQADTWTSGIETELVHLYDLDFKGCRSCFSCKKAGSPSYGRCTCPDGLEPVLEEIYDEADVLFVGSPIYWWDVTGEMRMFVERLFFSLHDYAVHGTSAGVGYPLGRPVPVGGVFTMNVTRGFADTHGLRAPLDDLARFFGQLVGPYEELMVCDTPVFLDYEGYVTDAIDQVHKAEVRAEHFPLDREQARAMGRRLASL